VVFDGEGYFMGAGLAEVLAAEHYSVQLVTPAAQVAFFCDATRESVLLRRRLHELGVAMRANSTLVEIGPTEARFSDEFDGSFEMATDAVVLVTQRLSNESLYLDLVSDEASARAEGLKAVYRVGDCVAPRLLADTIFDGHRLAREIDSPDARIPLPPRRERATVSAAPAAFPG
jgi:dimethylamine/trimethylamine dehydrogenase